jgi:hypothetical protein
VVESRPAGRLADWLVPRWNPGRPAGRLTGRLAGLAGWPAGLFRGGPRPGGRLAGLAGWLVPWWNVGASKIYIYTVGFHIFLEHVFLMVFGCSAFALRRVLL